MHHELHEKQNSLRRPAPEKRFTEFSFFVPRSKHWMNHTWNCLLYTIVESHVPGDPTQTYFTHFLFFPSFYCHSIAQILGNVDVCKGLENIGRRKNIDFLFEWKDEVQCVNFSSLATDGLMFASEIIQSHRPAGVVPAAIHRSCHFACKTDENPRKLIFSFPARTTDCGENRHVRWFFQAAFRFLSPLPAVPQPFHKNKSIPSCHNAEIDQKSSTFH